MRRKNRNEESGGGEDGNEPGTGDIDGWARQRERRGRVRDKVRGKKLKKKKKRTNERGNHRLRKKLEGGKIIGRKRTISTLGVVLSFSPPSSSLPDPPLSSSFILLRLSLLLMPAELYKIRKESLDGAGECFKEPCAFSSIFAWLSGAHKREKSINSCLLGLLAPSRARALRRLG